MANQLSHAALPYAIRNARFTIAAGFAVAAGTPTDPTTPDTEISTDGGASFSDAAEEITTGGSNGAGHVTLSGAETNNNCVIVAMKSANCLTRLLVFYPRALALIGSGTLSAGSAGGGTLGTLLAYDVTGCFIRTTGGTGGGGTGGANNQARKIITYDTTTGAFTVLPDWATTPDATTTYDVLLPEGVTLGMLQAINPATPGRKPVVDSAGLIDANAVKVGPSGSGTAQTAKDLGALNVTNVNTLASHDPGSTLAASAEVTGLNVNTRANIVVPSEIETPDSGTQVYKIRLFLFDVQGNMEAPDSTPTIALVNAAGTDRSSRLSAASNPGTGVYSWDYTATDDDAEEQLNWTFTVVEGGLTRTYPAVSYVVEETAYRFSSTDRANLNSVLADTNELQTDWTNGGRLDLLVDGVKAKTDQLNFQNGIVKGADIVASGTVDTAAFTPTTLAFDSSIAVATGVYNDLQIVFRSGNLSGQCKSIASQTLTSGRSRFLVESADAWTQAPANGDAFDVIANHTHSVSQTQNGLARTGADGDTLETLSDQMDLLATAANLATLAGKFTGITLLAQWLGLIAGKQVGDTTARTELRATGVGAGTFSETTDSLEAIRDRGDSSWSGGGGGGGTIQNNIVVPQAVAVASQTTGLILCIRGDALRRSFVDLGDVQARTKCWFTVKERVSELDSAALVQITEADGLIRFAGVAVTGGDTANGSITWTNEDDGDVTIYLSETITAQLTIGRKYVYDLQLLYATGPTTPLSGEFQIAADVTRAVS